MRAAAGGSGRSGSIEPAKADRKTLAAEQGGGLIDSDALADALRAHVKARLAPYKYPRWVDFVAELPKTATGKIQRFKLRQS